MADNWTITIQKGASYIQSITVDGVADIASATGWSIRIGVPGSTELFVASTANGFITAGSAANNKILNIPSGTTQNFAVGNYRFDFDITWSGKSIRYYTLGQCLVQPKVGT